MSMQSQEQSHQGPESLPPDERGINIDPRERPLERAWQQEDTDRSYAQGYSGLDEQESWSREGEKLRPRSKHRESMAWPLLLVVLLCAVFIAAGLFGLILSWLSWLLVAVVLIACMALLTSNRHVTTRTLPLSTFQIMEHARLNLRNHSGQVSLHRGEEGIISVAATIHARGIDYENTPIRYDQHGDSLTISNRVGWSFLLFGSKSVDFDITVPASCDIHVSNDSGKIVLRGTSGDIRVRTDHGSVEAHDLQGRITLKTDHGNIEASNLQGQFHLQTDHGDISADGLQGSAKIKTDKGDISVRQSTLIGSSRLSTDAGLISFEGTLDLAGDYEMRSDEGTITVTLPPDASFYLDAKTDVGSIATNLPLMSQQKKRVSGSVGNGPGYPRLRLKTDVGSINLWRR
jgi:DUF4097 and DUF4098 domain-containing protein YvlB